MKASYQSGLDALNSEDRIVTSSYPTAMKLMMVMTPAKSTARKMKKDDQGVERLNDRSIT